ncbi:immunoglobulin superfamily member 3-like isoform X2 [Myripristis murdjan]|uniref:immunoglobulin superfamily member 3-like isoform X2 n=1 Tax=Myripristis murdjan TaxID=586833 RepID=UPI0011762BDD|nr:immunoglobulin superfamily member 3-like isoform X2 [Myripristis murdjan]
MRCFLQSLWRASVLFCLGLLVIHCGEARVLTEVPPGPLYRVVDSELSISCNVSGFRNNNTKKEFEFRMYRPANPNSEINIISSREKDFSYAIFDQRVRNKEVTLEYVSPNSVFFKIKHLQKGDEGEYECFAINIESGYDGIYAAKITVKVIDNSLIVSSPMPPSVSHNEGDTLTLTCQASSNTVQHTHLSVTWYLHKDGEDLAHPIISLDRDFTLSPGQGFEGRYQSGLIQLDKVGEATYRLTMAQLEPSDQGKIHCQAEEWIQDPDRSWYSIAQKDAEATTLTVKAKEVVSDKSSLVVTISAQQTGLQEGQELSLSCSVDAQDIAERFFSVAWLREGVELARIGPTGVLSVGPLYSGREKKGELRASRIRNQDHQLILQPVGTSDQGEYMCRAWPEDRDADGRFTQGAAKDSNSLSVTISAAESGLSVEMEKKNVRVNEGDRLQLTCKVRGVKSQLSVTWQHKSTPAGISNVIALTQEGVMVVGPNFAERKVVAMRPATDTFTLELNELTPSDSGSYQCTVTEGTTSNSQSDSGNVSVTAVESLLKVRLTNRNPVVTVGDEVELVCRLNGPRLPVTLRWSVKRGDSSPDTILTLAPNGDIDWSGDQSRYQLKSENFGDEVQQTLLITGASHREAALYRCEVSVFLENRHKRIPPSNLLALMVKNPVSKLALASTPTVKGDINTDIEITCSVTKPTSTTSRFAVTWLVQQQAKTMTILTSDRDGVVTFGPQVESSQGQRISMMRSEGPSFDLTIRQARIGDSGLYFCRVVEWLQDPRGQWYELPPVNKTTELNLTEPLNDLSMDKTEQEVTAKEGAEVDLMCSLTSGAFSPSFLYTLTWLYTASDRSVMKVPLVKLDHTGLLKYPTNKQLLGLQRRIRLSRPTPSSFHLGIQPAHEGDSGTYQCQVEQYQLDPQGHWQQKASDDSGPITLSVNTTVSHLSVEKEDMNLNVTGSQDFSIPCHITAQPSQSSAIQVTWFWQKETDTEQLPIFTVYRNSTLEDRSGRGNRLRFDHPVPNHFNLTVLKSIPGDSGLYFCEAEEWLLSLSQGWRKVAVDKSGNLSVSVHTEGDHDAVSSPGCSSSIALGVPIAVIVCLVIAVIFLGLKICRGQTSGAKKPNDSLWAEKHPLEPKPSPE